MNSLIPSYQIITNTKQKNKLLAKDYYEDTLKTNLNLFKSQNFEVREFFTVANYDIYIRNIVGKQIITNEFYTGLQITPDGKNEFKRKNTKKTLIANISRELQLPELAISYVYDDLIESDLLRTKKNDAKHFVNINLENSLSEIELAIMDAKGKDKAELIKAKTSLLKLYLESNDAMQKGSGTTINNVTGAQTNLNNSNIQNNQHNSIETGGALNDAIRAIVQKRKQLTASVSDISDEEDDIYDA